MRLDQILKNLPAKKGAMLTLVRGKTIRHSYASLANEVAHAKKQLIRWNVMAGMRVGIFAPNSYSYVVYDLALIDLGAISVPFTDDFAGSLNRDLIDKYNISLLLISKSVVHSFNIQASYVAFIDGENGNISALDRRPFSGNDDSDDLCLAFSSGSAGGLKGLVVSRKGVELTLPPVTEIIGAARTDRFLLFLPMSNIQQRMMYYAAIWYDFDIIISDYTQLYPVMKALQPSILIAPPIFYQLMHTRFSAPKWKGQLQALQAWIISLLPDPALRQRLAKLVFREFYSCFGNKIRLVISGMAPLSHATSRFFDRMQLPLCESYGMAEVGSLTYRPSFSGKYGSVGKPLKGVNISLAEDGEIIVGREKFLTRKYFQCAPGENESTFLAIDRVATGDIGKFDGDGYLYLLGRKKELIVTLGGYKVHPEVLEGELDGCADIMQSVVFQRPSVSYLTCVVVLGQDRSEGAGKRIKKYIDELMMGRKVRIGEIAFAEEPFSRENGLLRPNLKLNRKEIAAKYCI